jgi:pentatricopeptide repeat protein
VCVARTSHSPFIIIANHSFIQTSNLTLCDWQSMHRQVLRCSRVVERASLLRLPLLSTASSSPAPPTGALVHTSAALLSADARASPKRARPQHPPDIPLLRSKTLLGAKSESVLHEVLNEWAEAIPSTTPYPRVAGIIGSVLGQLGSFARDPSKRLAGQSWNELVVAWGIAEWAAAKWKRSASKAATLDPAWLRPLAALAAAFGDPDAALRVMNAAQQGSFFVTSPTLIDLLVACSSSQQPSPGVARAIIDHAMHMQSRAVGQPRSAAGGVRREHMRLLAESYAAAGDVQGVTEAVVLSASMEAPIYTADVAASVCRAAGVALRRGSLEKEEAVRLVREQAEQLRTLKQRSQAASIAGAYSGALATCQAAKDWPAARAILSVAMQEGPGVNALGSSAALRAATQAGDALGGLAIMEAVARLAAEASEATPSPHPGPHAIAEWILSVGMLSNEPLLWEASRAAETAGYANHPAVQHALLRAASRVGCPDLARLAFDRLAKNVAEVAAAPWNTLITAFARVNDVEGVMSVLDEMAESGTAPTDQTLWAVLSSMKRRMDASGARASFDKILGMGLPLRMEAWEELCKCLGRCGDGEGVRKAMGEMREGGWKPSEKVWVALITAYGVAGNLFGAEEALSQALKEGLSTVPVWGACADAYARVGDAAGVKGVRERALEHGGSIDAFRSLHSQYVKALAVSGRFDEAREALTDKDMPSSPHAWMAFASEAVNAGMPDEALRAALGSLVAGAAPLPSVMVMIVQCFAKAGDATGAERAAAALAAAGAPWSTPAWNTLASAYARGGDVAGVLEVQQRMLHHGLAVDSYGRRILLNAHAQAGDPEGCRRVIQHIREVESAATPLELAVLLNAYAVIGDASQVELILCEAEALAEAGPSKKVPAVSSRITAKQDQLVSVYNSAIKVYAVTGDPTNASKVVDRMRKRGLQPSTVTVNSLIDAYSAAGDPRGGERALKALADLHVEAALHPSAEALTTIMDAWATHGQVDDAERIMQDLESQGSADGVTYSSLARAYASVADPEGSVRVLRRCIDNGVEANDSLWTSVLAAHERSGAADQAWAILSERLKAPSPVSAQLVQVAKGVAERHPSAAADSVIASLEERSSA